MTDMSELFKAPSYPSDCLSSPRCSFNDDITSWDTSQVTDMSKMFYRAKSFNQPIGEWNTTRVEDMSYMFHFAESFNQSIGSWNTARVRDMHSMFRAARSFNQPIGSWNTEMVTDMSSMFTSCVLFNQPLGSWNTARVKDMSFMFASAKGFNQPIGGWNTARVQSMTGMFADAANFNQPIGSWNTANVEDMRAMFKVARAFNGDLSSWSTCKVKDFSRMFIGACQFLACQTSASVDSWCMGSIESSSACEDMFTWEGWCEGSESTPCWPGATTYPSTAPPFCNILVMDVTAECGQEVSEHDADKCSDMVTASLAEEDSSLCQEGCKSVHSLESMVGTLYNLNLADMIVIYIALAFMFLYLACVISNEKEKVCANIVFMFRGLAQLTDLILQVWAIVLSYSSAANLPDEIMKRKCINQDGIMGLSDLAGALDAISVLGPIELLIGYWEREIRDHTQDNTQRRLKHVIGSLFAFALSPLPP